VGNLDVRATFSLPAVRGSNPDGAQVSIFSSSNLGMILGRGMKESTSFDCTFPLEITSRRSLIDIGEGWLTAKHCGEATCSVPRSVTMFA